MLDPSLLRNLTQICPSSPYKVFFSDQGLQGPPLTLCVCVCRYRVDVFVPVQYVVQVRPPCWPVIQAPPGGPSGAGEAEAAAGRVGGAAGQDRTRAARCGCVARNPLLAAGLTCTRCSS